MPPGRAEAVGELGHQGLALVHGPDDVELREACVPDFAVHQRPRHDAYHLAAGPQRGVGDDAHQADVAAAVDERGVPLCEYAA